MEGNHGFDLNAHRCAGGLGNRLGIGFLFFAPFGNGPALRQIPMNRVMGRCLIGDDIGANATFDQFREDVGRIADQGNRFCLARLGPAVDHFKRFVKGMGFFIDIAGTQTEVRTRFIAFNRKTARTGHHGCQRLCATHAAKTAGQDPFALKVAAIMLTTGLDKGFIGALNNAL